MSAFLESLAKKLAERWLSVLVLPGALWMATAVTSAILGWQHPFAFGRLGDAITRWATETRGVGAIVLVLVGILAAGAGVGLAANGFGTLIRRIWLVPGRRWPARAVVASRVKRWRRADGRVGQLAVAATREADDADTQVVAGRELSDAISRRDAISLVSPNRPTWIGDRWQATMLRVRGSYGLDLTVVWPRLWVLLPEPVRADVAAAQTAYTAASTLLGWGVFYAALGVLWWPAFVIGGVVIATGVMQARAATDVLCVLVETAADLHGRALAHQLAVDCSGPMTFEIGDRVTSIMRKHRPEHPHKTPGAGPDAGREVSD